MNNLLWVVLIIAVINWIASDREWNWFIYITKPLTLILLIIWFTLSTQWQGASLWFGLGLVFSLFGDIFLMLPEEQFLPGLGSFLIAHLMYIIGLNTFRHPVTVPSGLMIILVLLLFSSLVWIFYRNMITGEHRRYIIPVFAYMIVISTMLLSAVLTLINPEWRPLHAILVASGAVLFFLSDTVIGWNKFITPINRRNLIVMSTYHLGQLGIIIGAVLQFSS